jgi:hypothetical protein
MDNEIQPQLLIFLQDLLGEEIEKWLIGKLLEDIDDDKIIEAFFDQELKNDQI